MAKRSSRKSSSGDEALLWGIAAVVVAIVGVGTAIMLTRGKSACANVMCSNNQVKTGKTTWKTDKSECCKPVPTDTSCYRALRQGTGKYVKNFVQKANNKTNGKCPTGWVDQSQAGLKKGTYQTIEEKSTNQCYNNYFMPPDYDTKKCLQAGDCDATSFTDNKCKTAWKNQAPCTVKGGNGACTSKVNNQGKRNCVGGDQLCGVNLADHTKAHSEDKTCADVLQYAPKMIKCTTGYTASVESDQGNCLFKCDKKAAKKPVGKCCHPDGGDLCSDWTDETTCNYELVNGKKCSWNPSGKCNTENFRMRRRRR